MRYEDADDSLNQVFNRVIAERFNSLQYLNFKLVYDTNKRMKVGQIVLASTEVASPKVKFFTMSAQAEDGYDCIMFIDKKGWGLASELDRVRIISHELRHVYLDEKGNPKILNHEISDFYAEIALNADDQEWARKLSTLVFDIYEQEKDVIKGSVI